MGRVRWIGGRSELGIGQSCTEVRSGNLGSFIKTCTQNVVVGSDKKLELTTSRRPNPRRCKRKEMRRGEAFGYNFKYRCVALLVPERLAGSFFAGRGRGEEVEWGLFSVGVREEFPFPSLWWRLASVRSRETLTRRGEEICKLIDL